MKLPTITSLSVVTLGFAGLWMFACGGTTVTQFPAGTGGTGGTGGASSSSTTSNNGGASSTTTAQGGNTVSSTSTAGGGDPCDCGNDAYIPVCGEDDMTYNANCGVECVPVEIDCEGECPCEDVCAELEEDYQKALQEAKGCSPFLSVEQCTAEVDDALGCPCPTFVNPQESSFDKLAELKADWDALQCGATIDCPEIACPQPSGGICTPTANGNDGVCEDVQQ